MRLCTTFCHLCYNSIRYWTVAEYVRDSPLIDDRTIIDAEGPDGQPFDADVQEAFLLWMQRHGLEESSVYSSPSDEDDSYFCF